MPPFALPHVRPCMESVKIVTVRKDSQKTAWAYMVRTMPGMAKRTVPKVC